MEEQFLVQGKSTGAKMTFTFTDGMLTAYEFQGEMSRKQYTWLVNYFPFTLEMIEWMRKAAVPIMSIVILAFVGSMFLTGQGQGGKKRYVGKIEGKKIPLYRQV